MNFPEVEEYKAVLPELSEKDRADMEADLYERLLVPGWRSESKTPGARGGTGLGQWFVCQGISGAKYRCSIRLLGERAAPLWERLDKKTISLKSACEIAVWVRKGESTVDAELKKYDSGDLIKMNGALIRRQKPRSTNRRPVWERSIELGDTDASDVAGEKGFWTKLKAELVAHFRAGCSDIPGAAALGSEMCREIEALVSTYVKKVRTLRERTPVSIAELAKACAVLNHDEPGDAPDLDTWLRQASKRKKLLAKSYHPDAHGGDEATRGDYEAVIDAYIICERYVRERKTKRSPRLVILDGGQKGHGAI